MAISGTVKKIKDDFGFLEVPGRLEGMSSGLFLALNMYRSACGTVEIYRFWRLAGAVGEAKLMSTSSWNTLRTPAWSYVKEMS